MRMRGCRRRVVGPRPPRLWPPRWPRCRRCGALLTCSRVACSRRSAQKWRSSCTCCPGCAPSWSSACCARSALGAAWRDCARWRRRWRVGWKQARQPAALERLPRASGREGGLELLTSSRQQSEACRDSMLVHATVSFNSGGLQVHGMLWVVYMLFCVGVVSCSFYNGASELLPQGHCRRQVPPMRVRLCKQVAVLLGKGRWLCSWQNKPRLQA